MIIPVFKGLDKAPNNTTVGLGRGASIAVKAAAAGDAISGKAGDTGQAATNAITGHRCDTARRDTGKAAHRTQVLPLN